MIKKELLLQLIPEQGVLPLYFHQDPEVSVALLKALYSAGIRAVEYTNRGEAAFENFKLMREICDKELKEMYLGIGTVTDGETAQRFIDAGTDFIVCPGLAESVAKTADAAGILWIPGCMTPSEIIAADHLGAKMIKLFPGNLLGPSFVSAIKPVFRHLQFMPTGGVDMSIENLEGWFKSGVCAVGMGSKLVSKDLLQERAYDKIKENTVNVIEIIKQIR